MRALTSESLRSLSGMYGISLNCAHSTVVSVFVNFRKLKFNCGGVESPCYLPDRIEFADDRLHAVE
jgi:hypothetical protein